MYVTWRDDPYKVRGRATSYAKRPQELRLQRTIAENLDLCETEATSSSHDVRSRNDFRDLDGNEPERCRTSLNGPELNRSVSPLIGCGSGR